MNGTRLQEVVQQQAERLGFEIDNETITEITETSASLASTAADFAETDGERRSEIVHPVGRHDELLATYDSPRQRTEDGLIAGLSVAVKDNITVDGLPMTCGSQALAIDPGSDATVTTRILDEGGQIRGKANQDAFAFGPTGEFSDYGTVTNPIDSSIIPGGSSSGSGAAVAAGTVDLALGSDTGGSVRIPAACCAVVGVKPTYGVVPQHGFLGFAPSLDTIGPIARDLETAEAALAAIVGTSDCDPLTREIDIPDQPVSDRSSDTYTIGLPEQFFSVTDDVVADHIRQTVEDAGFDVERVEIPLGDIEDAYFLLGACEFAWYLDQNGTIRGNGADYSNAIYDMVQRVRDKDLGPHIAKRVLPVAAIDAKTDGRAYLAARREGVRFSQRVQDAFTSVDALVLPTIRTLPPERGTVDSTDDMRSLLGNTAPFNITGNPAVSVPIGSQAGRPMSAQVVTPPGSDFTAIGIASVLEQ